MSGQINVFPVGARWSAMIQWAVGMEKVVYNFGLSFLSKHHSHEEPKASELCMYMCT